MEIETRSVSISDIAASLGVTKATVSYALNGKGRVSPLTRQKILDTAQQMGFQPNPHAQRLSTGRAFNTVALCFQLDLGVNARKWRVIQELLMQRGYEIPSHALSQGRNSQVTKQTTDIVSMVCRQRPRALACNKLPLRAIEVLKRYQADGGILVCYDIPMDIDCDKVIFDRENSSYCATQHLLELGHRDIGFCSPGDLIPVGSYVNGYRRALQEAGITPENDWIFGVETHSFNAGIYEEAGAQLAQQFLQLERRPSALCITDDYAAMAFAVAVEEAGLRVPQDVSIVGHDDSPIAHYGKLKITTVTHPVSAIAHQVVDFLTSRIERNEKCGPRQVTLKGDLIVRESAAQFEERHKR